jgi:seryl-tRNA synthetase
MLRENPDAIRESQRRRGESVEIVDRLVNLDQHRRTALTRFEGLRARHKDLGRLPPAPSRLAATLATPAQRRAAPTTQSRTSPTGRTRT